MKGLKQIDDSTIWQDGSRTYPPAQGKPKDPPGTWPFDPSMGGIPVEIPDETPAQRPGPVLQYNPGPLPPVLQPPPVLQANVIEVVPLPAGASVADVWDRWQKLTANWPCLIAWGGGDLDKLTVAVGGNLPFYNKGGVKNTAIGWWRAIVSAGYDKAATPADLGKGLGVDANDVSSLIAQLNDLGAMARAKGYTGCPVPASQNPAAPPAAPTPLATAQGWWNNLSTGGKVVTGGVVLGGLALLIRGAAK